MTMPTPYDDDTPVKMADRLHRLAEATGGWLWETDENDRLTYIYCAEEIKDGFDPRALLGRRRSDCLAEMSLSPDLCRSIDQAIEERQAFAGLRCDLKSPAGRPHYLKVSGRPSFDEAGRFTGYRGVAAEVTAEIEAEKAHRGKTRFLAAASHDLRQPLQAMGLFVATLASQELPPAIAPIVLRIENAMAALEQLLDTLLDMSRLDSGAVEAEFSTVPLNRLFKALAAEFQPLADAKGLRLIFVPTQATVRSDPHLLERILRNLIANAINYTDKGGVLVGARKKGATRRIEVRDSGCGIEEAELRTIFLEFHRLKSGDKNRRQGLGLGLSIVERLAALLGHRIQVKSWPGKGSVFCIDIDEAAA